MTGDKETIQYGQQESLFCVRLQGKLTHCIGNELSVVQRLIESDQRIECVVINAVKVSYLDSTCLGILAKIARCMIERQCPQPNLVVVNEDLELILMSIGFDTIFAITKTPVHKMIGTHPLGHTFPDTCLSKDEQILDAHRELIELSERNRAEFSDLVEMLEIEIEAKKKNERKR